MRAQKIRKDLFHLREEKRDLKRRIGQSMRDGGSFGTTGKCKKLQRQLSQVVKKEKSKKRKLQQRW